MCPSELARCAIEGCEREPLFAFPTPLVFPLRPAAVCARHRSQLDASINVVADAILADRLTAERERLQEASV